MKKWHIATVVVALLAAASVSWAQPQGRQGGGREGWQHHGRPSIENALCNPEVIEKLGLTDEQVTALQNAADEKEKKAIALDAERKTLKLEMKKLMRQDAPDEAAVLALVEKEGAVQTELRKLETSYRLKARATVGPEKLKELRKDAAKKMRKRQKDKQRDGKKGKGNRERTGKGDGGQKGPPWMDDDGPEEDSEM